MGVIVQFCQWAFEGVFVCTTNLMAKLDQTSLRCFAFKVRFNPLNPGQRWQMFRQELERLGGCDDGIEECENRVRRLQKLTPGDFAVAARQFELWDLPASPGSLYEQLQKKCVIKREDQAADRLWPLKFLGVSCIMQPSFWLPCAVPHASLPVPEVPRRGRRRESSVSHRTNRRCSWSG